MENKNKRQKIDTDDDYGRIDVSDEVTEVVPEPGVIVDYAAQQLAVIAAWFRKNYVNEGSQHFMLVLRQNSEIHKAVEKHERRHLAAGGSPDGDWRNVLTSEQRNQLMQKILYAIFPYPYSVVKSDQRTDNLVSYAERVEKEIYDMAPTLSDYYLLIAEKIFKIQIELEKIHASRLKKIQLLQQQHQQLADDLAAGSANMSGDAELTEPLAKDTQQPKESKQ